MSAKQTKSFGKLLKSSLVGAALLVAIPASANDIGSAYDTASLMNFHSQFSSSTSLETSLESQRDIGLGLGLSYKLDFGPNVTRHEKFGKTSFNFNVDRQGQSAALPLAEMRFGQSAPAAYDRFGLTSSETQSPITFSLLGTNLSRMSADDDEDEDKDDDKDGGVDVGDVGLLAGGAGLLLLGGTVAVLAID